MIIKRAAPYLVTIAITAAVTAFLYRPVSLAFYKISEPNFRCPIKLGPRGLLIRNDQRGDGQFGAKRGNGRSHSGIDISAPVGTPVYASKSGIAFRGRVPTGHGKYVMLYHLDGDQTIYSHLSDWKIASVQKVRQGEIIGFTGKTGNAAASAIEPHLHFEIRKSGEPQDPRTLIR